MQTQTDNNSPARDRLNPVVFRLGDRHRRLFDLGAVATQQAMRSSMRCWGWISNTFGWYYFLTVVIYLAFVIFLGVLASARSASGQNTPGQTSISSRGRDAVLGGYRHRGDLLRPWPNR
ncbi:BCCT family transporter [Salinicola tamaricis]|uniref:BCCT family transporter n=1 Tax=Salinicola tamaricis TaxID=1771309 RepID=UPI001F5D7542|nr:BCCT family transporter [Salinicola tamaricis]